MTAARASQALRHAWPGTRHLSSPRYFCPVDGARPQPGPCACVRVCGRLWGAVRCRVRVFSGTLVSEEGRSCLCVEVLGRELPQPQTKGCSELPEVCVCVGGAVRVPGQRHAGCCTLMPLIPSPSTPFPEASGWPEPVSSSGACAQWAVVLGVRAEPTPGTPVRASGEVGRGAPAVCGHPLLQEACPDHPRESSSGSRVAVFP